MITTIVTAVAGVVLAVAATAGLVVSQGNQAAGTQTAEFVSVSPAGQITYDSGR